MNCILHTGTLDITCNLSVNRIIPAKVDSQEPERLTSSMKPNKLSTKMGTGTQISETLDLDLVSRVLASKVKHFAT